MFESIARPKYAEPAGRTTQAIQARAALTTEPARKRSFWECLFGGAPEYEGSGSGNPSPGSVVRSLTLEIRCPRITEDHVVFGPDVIAALPAGATNVRVWSSGTRAATPNEFVGAFLVGVAPGGIARLGDQITFSPLWVRFVNDAIDAGSLIASLLVTFET